ncbi:MAG: hypothetical protein ACHBN1_37430 [Heteroscytonema crispum UTEX LB 1556]
MGETRDDECGTTSVGDKGRRVWGNILDFTQQDFGLINPPNDARCLGRETKSAALAQQCPMPNAP